MIVYDLNELSVMAVLKRGAPNDECVAIKVIERTNLGQYGIMLGVYAQQYTAKPLKDNMFWFGDGLVEKDDWVFIYTGIGKPRMSKSKDGTCNIYTIFWGRERTIFANTNIVPILFRVDAVYVLPPPDNLPQIENKQNTIND